MAYNQLFFLAQVKLTLNCDHRMLGSSVKITRFGGPIADWLVLCEVHIFAQSDQREDKHFAHDLFRRI